MQPTLSESVRDPNFPDVFVVPVRADDRYEPVTAIQLRRLCFHERGRAEPTVTRVLGKVLDLELYRGRDVVVVQEHEPGAWVADRLVGIAASVKLMRFNYWASVPELDTTIAALPEHATVPAVLDQMFQRACDIVPSTADFLWDGLIPLGMLSMLVGDPGWGKSTLNAWLAARVSRGELPGALWGRPASVLYCSAEDAQAQVIVPRLMAAGADMKTVILPKDTFGLTDTLDKLEGAIAEHDVRLLMFDPLVSYADGNRNLWMERDVRDLLDGLHGLVARHHVAALSVMHFNKKLATNLEVVVGNSKAFVNVPRSVLYLAEHPQNPPRGPLRVLAHGKNNLGEKQATTVWQVSTATVGNDIQTGRLEPTGDVVDETDRDLLALRARGADDRHEHDQNRGSVGKAVTFLRGLLANGPVDADQGAEQAEDAGVTAYALKQAKKRLGVVSKKSNIKDGGWLWVLDEKRLTESPIVEESTSSTSSRPA